MGRKRLPTDEKRKCRLQVRMSEKELALLDALAAIYADGNASTLVRDLILVCSAKQLAEQKIAV